MLFVTNRSWKFGVSGNSHSGMNPVFLSDLYSFRVLRHFRVTHWSCTIFHFQFPFSFQFPLELHCMGVVGLEAPESSQDSSFFVSLFLIFFLFLRCFATMFNLLSSSWLNTGPSTESKSTAFYILTFSVPACN